MVLYVGVLQLLDKNTQIVSVRDEICPEDASNLAFSRGSFVMYTKTEEVIMSGRLATYLIETCDDLGERDKNGLGKQNSTLL